MNDIAFPKPSMTAKDIFKDQIGATKNDEVTTFSLKAQMLDQGRTDTVLAARQSLLRSDAPPATVRLRHPGSNGGCERTPVNDSRLQPCKLSEPFDLGGNDRHTSSSGTLSASTRTVAQRVVSPVSSAAACSSELLKASVVDWP